MKSLYFLLILLFCLSCKHSEEMAAIQSPSVDTLPYAKYDTLSARPSITYTPKKEIIDFFTPYFVKDICPPGDYNHPIYKNFFQKAQDLLPIAMNTFIQEAITNERTKASMIKKLGSIEELKSCHLEYLPMYYLTPNVVQYTSEKSIQQFYTLKTDDIMYQLLKGKQLIDIIKCGDGYSFMLDLPVLTASSYQQVVAIDKQPIGLINNMRFPHLNMSSLMSNFGYFQDNTLFMSRCKDSQYTSSYYSVTEQQMINTNKVDKGCSIFSADTYFASIDFNSQIEQEYTNRLKNP